jgi:hypothetical protein
MTSVNGVSRRPAGPNYKPLTWGNVVSEGGLEPPCRGFFPRVVKSPAACSSTAKTGEISPASVPEHGLDPVFR